MTLFLREEVSEAVAAAESSGIFISYRRQEASHLAGRLHDRLAGRFGQAQVFMDVDTIELGVDFAEEINRAVGTCKVLLAVIGPHWLTATDADGNRRLDDPDDIVRLEVEAALERDVRVIPILVEGAVMPRRQELPESLAALARRNALTIRHESFPYDAERLVAAIERVLGAGPPAADPDPRATAARLDERRFLDSLADREYREALRGLFEAVKSFGMVFEWGSVGSSIRLYTPDREEPLTVAWVFPDRAGWSGLRHLTLGFDSTSAAHTPAMREALASYVDAVGQVPGATRAKGRTLHAYTFAPDAVRAQKDRLVTLLRDLSASVPDSPAHP